MQRQAFLKCIAAAALSVSLVPASFAQDKGSKDEAKAMVEEALAHVKAVGADKAYADFTNDKAHWVKKDMYVFVFDMKGNTLAHGGNAKLVGKNLVEMRDAKGRSGVLEMGKIAASSGNGWYDYDFVHPITKQTAAKTSFVSKLPNVDGYVGVGVYR